RGRGPAPAPHGERWPKAVSRVGGVERMYNTAGKQALAALSQLVGQRRRYPFARLGLALAVLLLLAACAFGQGSAWEVVSVHAPTNLPLQPSVNQVATLSERAN